MQKVGLYTEHMEDTEFNLLCRHLLVLAFLPVNTVIIIILF